MFRSPTVLGRSPAMTFFGLVAGGIGLYITVADPWAENSLGEALFTALFSGFAILVGAAVATARLEAASYGFKVVNTISTLRVPALDVQEVSSENGLEFVLKSRESVQVAAFGQSVIGALLGYPRSTKAATRCNAWISELRSHHGAALLSSAQATTVAPRLWLLLLYVPIELLAGASYLLHR